MTICSFFPPFVNTVLVFFLPEGPMGKEIQNRQEKNTFSYISKE